MHFTVRLDVSKIRIMILITNYELTSNKDWKRDFEAV